MLKHLLCSHDDLGLLPRTHTKQLGIAAVLSVLGRQRQADLYDSLATNLAKLARSRLVRDLLQRTKAGSFLRNNV